MFVVYAVTSVNTVNTLYLLCTVDTMYLLYTVDTMYLLYTVDTVNVRSIRCKQCQHSKYIEKLMSLTKR